MIIIINFLFITSSSIYCICPNLTYMGKYVQ